MSASHGAAVVLGVLMAVVGVAGLEGGGGRAPMPQHTARGSSAFQFPWRLALPLRRLCACLPLRGAALGQQQQGAGGEAAGQALTKRERKAREKEERYLAKKLAKKAAKKAKRRARVEEERRRFAGLSPEDRAREQQAHIAAKNAREALYNAWLREREEAISSGRPLRVAFDLAYSDLMTDSEARSVASQVSYSHGANMKVTLPLDLHIVGCTEGSREHTALSKFDIDRWRVDGKFGALITNRSLLEVFPKKQIVYLTSEAERELDELDPTAVYVIGGLVDRNRHKGASFARAQDLGVSTARLPIERYITLDANPVMTCVHVVLLLQKVASGVGWQQALGEVLPQRKNPQPIISAAAPGARSEAGSGEHPPSSLSSAADSDGVRDDDRWGG